MPVNSIQAAVPASKKASATSSTIVFGALNIDYGIPEIDSAY